MIQSVQRWAAGTLAVALMALLGMGCAQDVEDIDRTQPDKIKKSLFNGEEEWYYTQTITDTDYQGSVLFEALESPLKRIRWEITEDYLYAYSTVDPVEGLTDEQRGEDAKLGAVAVFPIESHFDVQRQYSTSTGEPQNVIVENRTDRPWYNREYMRVDWSANLVDGVRMFGSQLGMLSSVAREVPQEKGEIDPNRAQIGEDYVDVTVQYAFQPDLMSCFQNLGYDAVQYCEGGKVKARNSFVRITDEMKNEGFKPMEYTDNRDLHPNGDKTKPPLKTTFAYDYSNEYRLQAKCNKKTKNFIRDRFGRTEEACDTASFDFFERFGYFRTRRIGYDKIRPRTDGLRKYYAQKWDIWTKKDGELVPKPVVYHLNAGYPKEMLSAADEVEEQWDRAFKEAIMLGSRNRKDNPYESIGEVESALEKAHGSKKMYRIDENSCHPGPLAEWKNNHGNTRKADRRSVQKVFSDALGSNPSGDALKKELWSMPPEKRMQLCANLEWATAPRSSQDARFTWEQVGDLRYSFFNWVREYNGYWSGYGPSSADPLTGEIVSADANFSGTPMYRVAAYGADLVKYMNGELDKQDVRYGTHVRKYINKLQRERKQQSLSPEELPAHAQKEFARRAGRDHREIESTNWKKDPELEDMPEFFKKTGVEKFKEETHRISRSIERTKDSTSRFAEFYEKPKVKRTLMKSPNFQNMVHALAKAKYGPEADDDARHQAYLDLATPRRMRRQEERAQKWMAKHNIMSTDRLERSMESLITYRGVAEAFKGVDREKIEEFFMENVFVGTQLHEVGHTVGLRHNFSASMDALNWHDAYWNIQKLRLKNDKVVRELPEDKQKAKGKVTVYGLPKKYVDDVMGDTNSRVEYPYISEEEFQQASVMDYTADLTGRFAGLGKYDQAAVNFVYGGHIQRWKDGVNLPNDLQFQKFLDDYTDLPRILGRAAGVGENKTQQTLKGIEIIKNGREWVSIDDAMKEKRKDITKSTNLWQKGKLSGDVKPHIDRFVDYNFCSDDRAGYQLGCDTGDHGGNHTEVVNHAFSTYRFFQPFWRYKGRKIEAGYQNINEYIYRVQDTLSVAERPFRYFSIYEWFGIDQGDYTADLQKASIDALNFYAEVLAMPEPGTYCKYTKEKARQYGAFRRDPNWSWGLDGTYVPSSWYAYQKDKGTDVDGDGQPDVRCGRVEIERGPAQFYNPDLTDTYEIKFERVGSYYDKLIATRSFFNVSANWVNSALITDSRTSNITFYSLFKDEMLNWIGSLIKGDFRGYAGSYNKVGGGEYEPPTIVTPNKFGLPNYSSEQAVSQGPAVMGEAGFNHQFNTLAGALLTNSSWLDQSVDFNKYIKIVKQDDDETRYDNPTWHHFNHPITEVRYSAPQTADDESISVELVERANNLKAKWKFARCTLNEFKPKDAAKESYDRQYLIDACDKHVCTGNGDCSPSLPDLDIIEDKDEEIAPAEKTRMRKERLADFKETRKRQMEDVIAKMTLVRDVNQLVDYE